VRLDVEVDAQALLAVDDGPAAARVHAHGPEGVAQGLHLADHGVPGVTDLEPDVVHAVAVLVEELPERGGVVVGLVQLDDEADALGTAAPDRADLERLAGDLAPIRR
jgi:hypothetical protein